MRSFVSRALGLLTAAAFTLLTTPADASAQKALVYCPADIDVAGCEHVVSALGADFPDGVDRLYDGSGGTYDVRTVDLWSYAVLVVPSLADAGGKAPYALLRDPAVSERLHDALMGRVALWSGTPDLGTTNRDLKDALIRSLAKWASGNYATVKGPGLVALQDQSDTLSGRYGWVRGITGVYVTADSAVSSYASVKAMTETGKTVLTTATGSVIAYTNMASLGFYLPDGAAGVTLDAVGQTGTSVGGQVVLMSSPGGNTGKAVIRTDRNDYAPGTVVTITGSGFAAGETVNMVLHEDPEVHDNRTLTSVADANGNFVNASFAPEEHDIGVRFILTATGATSGVRAEVTFTDATSLNTNSVAVDAQSPATLTAGNAATFPVSVKFNGNGSCTVALSVSTALPAGATAAFAPGTLTGTSSTTLNSTLTISTTAATPSGTTSFTVRAQGTGGTGNDCTISQGQTGTGTLVVGAPAVVATTLSLSAPSPASVTYGSTGPISLSATLTRTTGGAAVSGMTVTFTVNGASAGTATTNASGVATLSTYDPSALLAGSRAVQASSAQQTVGGTTYAAATSGTQTLSVTPKLLTATFAVADKPYDGTTTATITSSSISGARSGDDVAISHAAATASFADASAGTGKTVTGTGFTLTGAAAPNYSLPAIVTTTGNITARAVVVTPNSGQSKLFGTSDPPLTFTNDAGLAAAAFTGALSRASGENVGTYPIGLGTLSAGTNYQLALAGTPVTFAITPAAQTITFAQPASPAAFGTSFSVAPTSSSGLTVNVAAGGACSISAGSVTMTSGTGTCTLTATQAGNTNYSAATPVVREVAAAKASQTIAFTKPADPTFGDPAIQLTATAPGGAVSFSATGACSIASGGAMNMLSTTSAGSCVVTASQGGDGNYDAAPEVSYTLDVKKAASVVAVNCPAAAQTYTGAPQTPCSAAATGAGGLSVPLTPTYSDNTNVGTATASATFAGDANHTGSSGSGSFTIAKASSTTTVTVPVGAVYTGAPQGGSAVVTGVGGLSEVLSVTYEGRNGTTYPSSATPPTDAGDYTASASYAGDANHVGSSDSRPFSIAKAASVVALVCPTAPPTYTGAAQTPCSATATGAGGLSVPVTPAYTNNVNAGTASVTASYAGDQNHTASSATGSFEIAKANATVVVQGFSGTYDGLAHGATGSAAGVQGEDLGSLLSLGATFTNVPGGSATWSFAGNGNYNAATGSAAIAIARKALSVTTDPSTKVYGEANPPFSASYDGFVNGETAAVLGGTLAFGTTATAASPVGSYDVTPSGLTAGNYAITFMKGTLSITPRAVTVTAADREKTYGQTVTFAGTEFTTPPGGLVNGDAIASVTLTSTGAAAGALVAGSPYDIVASAATGTGLGNYDIGYAVGKLKVNKAALTVTPADQHKTYGTLFTAFTGLVTGVVNADGITASYGSTGAAAAATVAGSPYDITATLGDPNGKLPNYDVTLNKGQLTVERATPAISWTGMPSSMNQGAQLTAAQLNAFAQPVIGTTAVSGTIAYALLPASTPLAVGTPVYGVGAFNVLATFTSTDNNYTGATATKTLTVNNVAPTVTSILLPSTQLQLGASTPLGAKFTDPGLTDTHGATIDWDWDLTTGAKAPGSATTSGVVAEPTLGGPGSVTGSYTYTAPGVYTVRVTVTDNSSASGFRTSEMETFAYVVVYDPSGGFVTGGGWIDSPAGACKLTTCEAGTIGKANFGFVSRYQKGATTPSGSTEFQFKAGDLNFHSTDYQWLVVSGARAQYKGTGTINGKGSYNFLLTAVDGQVSGGGGVDKFRIKITDAGGVVVYDNQMGELDDSPAATALAGGSINIQAK